MFKLAILFSMTVCAFGAAIPDGMVPQLDGRIVGGNATTVGSFPWQISLQRNGGHSCGGSIYSPDVIITAAHCLQQVSPTVLAVRAGSTYWLYGGQLVDVAAFKYHEGYNPNNMVNDIAVIRLKTPLIFGPAVKSIKIATVAPENKADSVVSGWGVTDSGAYGVPAQLRYIDTKIVSRSSCASLRYTYGQMIKPSMICASSKSKDSCQGDSGGPLVADGVLVGVVSFGIGCAMRTFPGVYADVAHLSSWVVENAKTV